VMAFTLRELRLNFGKLARMSFVALDFHRICSALADSRILLSHIPNKTFHSV
jgi:hypothetical protein